MFNTYQWNSANFKKKARLFDISAWISMLLVLVVLFIWSDYLALVFLFLGIGMLSLVLSWRIQSKDRALKKPKS